MTRSHHSFIKTKRLLFKHVLEKNATSKSRMFYMECEINNDHSYYTQTYCNYKRVNKVLA